MRPLSMSQRRWSAHRALPSKAMPSQLTALERQVLGALILGPHAPIRDKTVAAVAGRVGLSVHDVKRTLRQLDDHEPPLVHRDVDPRLGIEFWIALEAAIAEVEDASPEPG